MTTHSAKDNKNDKELLRKWLLNTTEATVI